MIRDEVTELIKMKRFGIFLTIHSFHALKDYSSMEAIQSSGNNVITGERYEWTKGILEALVSGVPCPKARFPEKIWHAGLARDHLLKIYNFTSFRIEVTTWGQGIEAFRETGKQLLMNICKIGEYSLLYGEELICQ